MLIIEKSSNMLKTPIGGTHADIKTASGARKRPIVNCRLDAPIYCARASVGA
ncbi:hypothetical protein NIE88_06485 [Sporolactobacillus shoreicorticis]|nr:hypothetical protein [Sporolactobacillus shoreicorticis]MCO7125414.1 hypothetical protein [Sporolactobacillus shoreicorticis]